MKIFITLTKKNHSKWGGFINQMRYFDASFFNISTHEANLMDPQQRLFLEIVWKTIENAGYDPLSFSNKNVGIFAGIEFSEYQTLIHATQQLFSGHVATGNSPAMLANRVSYFFNLHGPSEVIDTACSSSLVAVNRAVKALRAGECSVAIAGGVSLMIDPDTFLITSQLGVLSSEGKCKTFDKTADGYVKGEGVVALLLKPYAAAVDAGDHIYAVIKGIAVNHGGKAQSLTAPNATAQSDVLIKAYKEANFDCETISYIETHGTGTELGDPIEIEGLKNAFLSQHNKPYPIPFCGLGSVKTNMGHLEPASGIASIIKVLLAMQHKILPKTLHQGKLNPYINLAESPFYIVNEKQNWHKLIDSQKQEIPRRAGVSSFGFGGTNAHIVLEEVERPITNIAMSKPYYIMTISAKKVESLQQKIVDLRNWLKENLLVTNLETLSYTLNVGRSHFEKRCVFVVKSLQDFLTTLAQFSNDQQPLENRLESSQDNEIYQSCLASLRQYKTLSAERYKETLSLIAALYIKKYPIDWEVIHHDESKQRVASLPTYAFLKEHYWFDAEIKEIKEIKEITEIKKVSMQDKVSLNSADLSQFTLLYLKTIFAQTLKITVDKIAVDITYEVYGVDSLLGLEITQRIQEDFPQLSKTILYEKNQIKELAIYLQEKYPNIIQNLYTKNIPTKQSSELKDIAIIGLSGIYPEANNLDEFWNNLQLGKDCITEIPLERWNYRDYPIQEGGKEKFYNKGGFISDIDKFDPLFFNIAPSEAALLDPQERLFMQSAWTTFEDAGYTREKIQLTTHNKVGVFAGVTYNFYPLLIAKEWEKGNRLPLDIQMFSVANRISYFLNLMGPSIVVDTACSSSLAAIDLACKSILAGECEMALAGGVNLSLHPAKYHFLGGYGFLSDEGRCASFGKGSGGYVPAEGVGCVLLKLLAAALRDNDRIYGIIKASRMNHGGKTSGYTVPSPSAQADLIKSVLADANIDPRSISYIEAHGTGTLLGDPIEVRGLQEAFEFYTEDKQFCAIGSVKSNIGHLESAAGISQLTKVLLQMQHKKLVPSLHTEVLNPYIDFKQTPFFVQQKLEDWQPKSGYLRRAGISSFGAGGTNIHLIVEEFPIELDVKKIENFQIPFIFLLSAVNQEQLREYAHQAQSYLVNKKNTLTQDEFSQWLINICYTSQVGRESFNHRLGIIAKDYNDLLKKLTMYLDETNILPQKLWLEHELYTPLIERWVKGENIKWHEIYSAYKPQIVSFITYPFAKRRCWVTSSEEKIKSVVMQMPNQISNQISNQIPDALDEWLYEQSWEESSKPAMKIVKDNQACWLVFSDNELGFVLQDILQHSKSIYCFVGTDFHKVNANTFYMDPSNIENYKRLFSILSGDQIKLSGIIYLWGLEKAQQTIHLSQEFYTLLQSLASYQQIEKLTFCLVGRGSQAVNNEDSIEIWQHPLGSMLRIFMAEQANYQALLVDLDKIKNLRTDATILVDELRSYTPQENNIAYRQGKRYVVTLKKYISVPPEIKKWIPPQAVLITGGLGALGVELTKWLIQQGTGYFLLTGVTHLSESPDKNESVLLLKKLSAHIKYVVVDVSDHDAMKSVISQAELEWQMPIKGVFHLAGVTTDSQTIGKMTKETLQHVLKAKVQGGLVLHELFNHNDLNCFVLFSSIAALPFFGMNGLSAYAMANEFLDGLAAYRRSQHLVAMSINWAAWADIGMSHRYHHGAFLEAVGMSSLAISKGLALLSYLMVRQPTNIIVFKITWEKFLQVNASAKKMIFFRHFGESTKDTDGQIKLTSHLSQEQIVDVLKTILIKLLALENTEIDITTPYQSYGLDSIIGIKFVTQLSEHFGNLVAPMDLYRYPNLEKLSIYIFQALTPTESQENNIQALTTAEVSQLIEDELSGLDGLT